MMLGLGFETTGSRLVCDSQGNCFPSPIVSVIGPGGDLPTTPMLPMCADITVPPGAQGPFNCDYSAGPPVYQLTASQVAEQQALDAQLAGKKPSPSLIGPLVLLGLVLFLAVKST
jgi:hypothetical protein